MAFYGYNGDAGEYYSTPYNTPSDYEFHSYNSNSIECYNSPSHHDYYGSSITPPYENYSVSVYDKHVPNLIQYDPIQYYHSSPPSSDYFDGFESRIETNYSVYSYREPEFVQYDPPPFARVYHSSATKSAVYKSAEQISDLDFDDYDPTPYSGGYDPSKTYGGPLPPSDETCYHRSQPQSDGPDLEDFSYSSIPSPYGENGKQIASKTDPQPHGENRDEIAEKVGDLSDPKTDGENRDKIKVDDVDSKNGEHELPPSYNHDDRFENVQIGRQIPYGSGLECVDLCESLFGYWPCLAKRDQEMNETCSVCDHGGRWNPWEGAADYIFGTPMPFAYDERSYGGYKDYGYEYGGYYQVQQPHQYESSTL